MFLFLTRNIHKIQTATATDWLMEWSTRGWYQSVKVLVILHLNVKMLEYKYGENASLHFQMDICDNSFAK